MTRHLGAALAALLCGSAAAAPDLDAGKAQAAAVCAACHGANGVSVSDGIPNLAGQRAAYLENQLKAWKDGSRKNGVMNAVAAQLSPADMSNLAAHFAAQPGVQGGAKSDFMPTMVKARINFPADYQASFTRYHVIESADAKSISAFWARSLSRSDCSARSSRVTSRKNRIDSPWAEWPPRTTRASTRRSGRTSFKVSGPSASVSSASASASGRLEVPASHIALKRSSNAAMVRGSRPGSNARPVISLKARLV